VLVWAALLCVGSLLAGPVAAEDPRLRAELEAAQVAQDRRAVESVVFAGLIRGEVAIALEAAWQAVELGSDDRLVLGALMQAIRNAEHSSSMVRLMAIMFARSELNLGWLDGLVEVLNETFSVTESGRLVSAAYERSAQALPDHEWLLLRSRLAAYERRPERALGLAMAAIAIEPQWRQVEWAVDLALQVNDEELALTLLEDARQRWPDNEAALLMSSDLLDARGASDQARSLLAAAPPSLPLLSQWFAISSDHAEQLIIRARLVDLESRARADGQHDVWLFRMAQMDAELDDIASAVDRLARIESGDNLERSRLYAAGLIIEYRLFDTLGLRARALLDELRDSEEDALFRSAVFAVLELELASEAGLSEWSLDWLSEALVRQPTDVDLLYWRGMVAVALDQLELAEQDWRRAIREQPDHAASMNALGYTLTDRTGRHREAYRLIQRALELEPDNPAILDSMGWVYYQLGQPEQAVGYLERALAGQDHPEIGAHLVVVLAALDRTEEASELLGALLQRHPDDDDLLALMRDGAP
jgi:tetratricopeptide (TPR) repeat protein